MPVHATGHLRRRGGSTAGSGFLSKPPDLVNRPADLAATAAEAGADLVVADLTRSGVVDALAAVEAPVVGFANHTSRDVMDAARAAGCEQVLPRSDFFARIDEVLAGQPTSGEPAPG